MNGTMHELGTMFRLVSDRHGISVHIIFYLQDGWRRASPKLFVSSVLELSFKHYRSFRMMVQHPTSSATDQRSSSVYG